MPIDKKSARSLAVTKITKMIINGKPAKECIHPLPAARS